MSRAMVTEGSGAEARMASGLARRGRGVGAERRRSQVAPRSRQEVEQVTGVPRSHDMQAATQWS